MVVLKSGWREYAIRIAAWQYMEEVEQAQYERKMAEQKAKQKN